MDWIRHSHINQTGDGLPIYTFILDSAARLSSCPTTTEKNGFAECCGAGSTAVTKDLKSAFLLTKDGWIEQ